MDDNLSDLFPTTITQKGQSSPSFAEGLASNRGSLQSRVDIVLWKVYYQDKKVTPETEEKQTSKV